jgi:class 3 adenylate cyclase
LAAVLDEVGSERAALLAEVDAGPTAIIFAASRPQRVRALLLSHATARFVAADDYSIGLPAEVAEAMAAQTDQVWGTEAMVATMAPSRAGDERFRRWLGKMVRAAASPRAAQMLVRAMLEADVRSVLPLIQAPTLVLHRRDAQLIPIEHGRYLADHIPGATLVERPGVDATFWETPDVALDRIEAFLAGVGRFAIPTRILTTVLFTDIVDSTELAGRLGDRRWGELLNVHDVVSRRVVEEFGGQLIKTTGDGMLATFDGPGRAIRCAGALRSELAGIGVQIRAGLHTGEVELRDGDVSGIAVHIAARILAAAQPGDIMTSGTVRDLIVGSDIALTNHGSQPLKGVEGTWQLFLAMRP